MPYQSQAANTIADLLLKKGQIDANTQIQSTAAWANGVQNLAQIGGSTLTGFLQGRQMDKKIAQQDLIDQEANRKQRALYTINDLTKQNTDENGNVDYGAISKWLRQNGEFADFASGIDDQARTRSNGLMNDAMGRIGAATTAYGKIDAAMNEIKKDPSKYEQFKPYLKDWFGAVAPDQVSNVPETYDPDKLQQLVTTTTLHRAEIDAQNQAMKDVMTARSNGVTALNMLPIEQKSLATYFAGAQTEDAWKQVQTQAKAYGISDDAIKSFGDWSPDAPGKAWQLGQRLGAEGSGGLGVGGGIKSSNSLEYNLYLGKVAEKTGEIAAANNGVGRALTQAEHGQLFQEAVQQAEDMKTKGFDAVVATENATRRGNGQLPMNSTEITDLHKQWLAKGDVGELTPAEVWSHDRSLYGDYARNYDHDTSQINSAYKPADPNRPAKQTFEQWQATNGYAATHRKATPAPLGAPAPQGQGQPTGTVPSFWGPQTGAPPIQPAGQYPAQRTALPPSGTTVATDQTLVLPVPPGGLPPPTAPPLPNQPTGQRPVDQPLVQPASPLQAQMLQRKDQLISAYINEMDPRKKAAIYQDLQTLRAQIQNEMLGKQPAVLQPQR